MRTVWSRDTVAICPRFCSVDSASTGAMWERANTVYSREGMSRKPRWPEVVVDRTRRPSGLKEMELTGPSCSASRRTEEKSRGQRRRKPSSEPTAHVVVETLRLLIAMPDPEKGRQASGPQCDVTSPRDGCPPTRTEVLLLCERNTRGLCRQQAADVLHSHALVVNLQDVTTMAANKSTKGRSRVRQGTQGKGWAG